MNLDAVAGISLITPERLENLARAVQATSNLPGVMAELGVYRGGSARVIAETCSAKLLHLFDTFAGLPYEEDQKRNPAGHDLSVGRFACRQDEVEHFLKGFNVDIHAGVFPGSTSGLEHLQFSFVHVDCDLYQSAIDAIGWFWPRMVDGGAIFFDDYGCEFTGVTDAVHEWFDPWEIEKQFDRSNGFQVGCLVVK